MLKQTILVLFLCFLLKNTAKEIGELVAECLKPCLGEGVALFSGVTDGGELASIRATAK